MPMLAWNPAKYSLGIAVVDAQHQKLFALLNQLYDAMQEGQGRKIVGPVLDRLIDYTVYHFETEEKLLREHGFPEEPAHRYEHEQLTTRAKDLKRRFIAGDVQVTAETLRFLGTWLNGHITGVDRKYAEFLHARGVR